jgi:8-oxo-dGTP pyrophosphatase MutT (NUDIX family)
MNLRNQIPLFRLRAMRGLKASSMGLARIRARQPNSVSRRRDVGTYRIERRSLKLFPSKTQGALKATQGGTDMTTLNIKPATAPSMSAKDSDVAIACPECDYDLRGASSDQCPSCGWPIDLAALLEASVKSVGVRRWMVVFCGLALCGLHLLALALTVGHAKTLTLWDGLSALAVVLAFGGLATVVTLSLLSRRRWPLRNPETARVVRFVALLSMIAGMMGAAQILRPDGRPDMVRGMPVNRSLEFGLAAGLFSLPGLSLLGMSLVSFRAGGRPSRATDAPDGPSPAEAVPFFVALFGHYRQDQVTVAVAAPTPALSIESQVLIEEGWKQARAEAESAGRVLYNGVLGRLATFEATPESLRLVVGSTTYREFIGTHVFNRGRRFTESVRPWADPLGTSALVLTKDGYLALGRRSRRVAYHAGYLHTFGGMLEEADRLDTGYDVFASVRRELHEELGVAAAVVADLVIVGLVRERVLFQPELLFEATVTLNRADLEAHWATSAGKDEHDGIEYVHDDPEDVFGFLRRQERVAPAAQAALLLRGRRQWTEAWYEQTCLAVYGAMPGRPP